MENLAHHCLIFARQWNMRELGKGFHGIDAKENAVQTLIVGAIIVVICVGLLIIDRYARSKKLARSADDPNELFQDLCRIHRLNRSSRRLLKNLAAECELEVPAVLFVEPEQFSAAKLPPEWHQRSSELDDLRKRLFEMPPA